ncbi:dihydrolipoamide acetyltransferase family protein [Aeromicrobium sp.]|uniref:dihydrolipoamide acetyltransferase family protein n=1 Tax=Aeromicrobium sp. TaxID=1871063 RepID=UPI0019A71B8B|nr:dihydrolipoamide acetyltransferase family protein [Aeromicrobium sp.]MBC7631952.1 2-oxo acid dehydrogenase subunit E2 [Aeromicrobium sp.]
MSEFKLPDVGEGLTEAEIVTWRVSVGDTVKVNDLLVDIETAKSIVELPSPYEGEVRELLVAEGQTVTVGTPIISIGGEVSDPFARVETAGVIANGGAAPAPAAHAASSAAVSTPTVLSADPRDLVPTVKADAPGAPARQSVLVGYGPRPDSVTRRRRKGEDAGPQKVASVDIEKVAQRPGRSLAKPPVRKLAKDLGIDLDTVPTAGDVVTRADVEGFAALRLDDDATHTEVATTRINASADDSGDVRVPINGVRKFTAEAMVRSAFTAPHVTEWLTLDVSRTMDLVLRLRNDKAFTGLKVSPTLIAAKAICLAIRRTPELNATWDDAAQEIVIKKSVNLGIAAATDRGLVVPNIVDAGSLSLVELATALGDLTDTARAGRTQPAQMSGGTFSLTNIGVFGIDAGTPILNPGESGILALGSIERRPWINEHDEVVPRWLTTLALSFDHRVVDGEQGSRFLADVAAILRDPALALTY